MTAENISETTDSHDDEFYKKVEDVHIRVSGLSGEEKDIRDGVYDEVIKGLVKIKKMIAVTDFTLNVKKYHESGSRHKFSIKVRVICDKEDFHADDHEWDIFKAVRLTLEKLEREIYKKVDRENIHSSGS